MRGAVLYGPRDIRVEERDAPTIIEGTHAIVGLRATLKRQMDEAQPGAIE
jgi:hypothetical protein